MTAADSGTRPGPRGRERLDRLLVDRGLVETRTRARALILAGKVTSKGQRLDKPGTLLRTDVPLDVEAGRRYVGRGAFKLAGALDAFEISVEGREAIDVGSSTGGFTEILLERGATRVVAIDVGRGILDWSLRNHPRVVTLEGVNARYLEADALPYRPSLASMDLAFIGLELVLPPVARVLEPGGEIVTLVKPQFEVGRRRVGRGGIVRDPALHREVLERLAAFALGNGWGVRGVCASPIHGAEGNREFFLHLTPDRAGLPPDEIESRIADSVRCEDESPAGTPD